MTPDLWSFIWRWQQSHSPSSGHQQISAWPLLPRMRRDLPCHFDHVEVPVSPVLTSVPAAVSAAAFLIKLTSCWSASCLKHFSCPGRNWQWGKAQRAQWHEQHHIPSLCHRHPTSPRAAPQPQQAPELNARDTWKHPRSRQPQRSVKKAWASPWLWGFVSLLREKQHKTIFSPGFFIPRPSPPPHARTYFSSNAGATPLKSAGPSWCFKPSMHMPGSSWYLQKAPLELAFDYTTCVRGLFLIAFVDSGISVACFHVRKMAKDCKYNL